MPRKKLSQDIFRALSQPRQDPLSAALGDLASKAMAIQNIRTNKQMALVRQALINSQIQEKHLKAMSIGQIVDPKILTAKGIDPNTPVGALSGLTSLFGKDENAEVPVFSAEEAMRLGKVPKGAKIVPQPIISSAQAEKMSALKDLVESTQHIRLTYKPEFVGAIDAPLQFLKQKTGFGASAQAGLFRSTLRDAQDALLRARSGAQINNQEYARLLSFLPNENMSEVDFLANLDRFEQKLNNIIANRKAAFGQAGFRNFKSQQQPFIMPPPEGAELE